MARRVFTLIMLVAFMTACTGCSDKTSKMLEDVLALLGLSKGGEKVSLTGSRDGDEGGSSVPEGLEFVTDEFTGMDLEITADVVTVNGGEEASNMDYSKTVELVNPEIIAYVDKESKNKKFTKIRAREGTVHPSSKRMDFEGDVVVDGPAGEKILADTLSWNYSQDVITVDDSFRMKDGPGFIEGEYLKTDIGFKFMEVE